jgi:hypothetical protein
MIWFLIALLVWASIPAAVGSFILLGIFTEI